MTFICKNAGFFSDPHRDPRQRRHSRQLRRGDRGGEAGGNSEPESVVADGSIDKVLSLCSNHLVGQTPFTPSLRMFGLLVS